MASLRDLYLQGEIEQRASPQGNIASFLEAALQGGMRGRELGVADKKERETRMLDTTLKLLNIQEKQETIAREKNNRRIVENLFKASGIVDLTEPEQMAARTAGLDGVTERTPAPNHTTEGKLSSFMIGDRKYGIFPSFSSEKGASFRMEEIKKENDKNDRDPANMMAKALQLSEDAARREKFNAISALLPPDEAQKFANVQPTDDEVQKYLPEFQAYLEGDLTKAKGARGKRKGNQSLILKHLEGIQSQIGELSKAEEDFRPFNENAKKKEKLKQRREKLLMGGDVQEVRTQLVEDINDLKKEPAKNRAEIVALTKQLIELSRNGR